jgi:hypothetical protein
MEAVTFIQLALDEIVSVNCDKVALGSAFLNAFVKLPMSEESVAPSSLVIWVGNWVMFW